LLPTPSSSTLPPVPSAALTSGPAGASSLSAAHSLTSSVLAGEETQLKKPKKERKERGRENGKEERKFERKRKRLVWLGVDKLSEIVLLVPKKMSKKRKLADGSRKLVQPIPLDSSGRPVFPIVLGGLTIYSLGEVSI